MDSLVAANTKFCFDLFQKISKQGHHRNVFCSPLSISAALGMVAFGARNDSAHQINKVSYFNELSQNKSKDPHSHLKSNKSGVAADSRAEKQESTTGLVDLQAKSSNYENRELSSYFGELLSKLDRIGADYTMSIANRLYGEQEFPIRPEYMDGVIQFYHTTIESVDFRKDTEKSREEINFWVESQSQGKIKELFSKESISSGTVLVLVNAVYLRAKWENYFDCKKTVDALFCLNENEKKTVKMMNQKGQFRISFIEDLQVQILEMRYTKGKLSMFILLPSSDSVNGLEELEKKITYEKLVAWTSSENMSEKSVSVSLPQFTLEDSYDLSSILQDMGIVDIFDEKKADLTGISSSPNLYLSKIVHKTFLEVDEDGSQAATASGAVGVTLSMPSYVTFNANRPFLFFIKHNKTQTLLFFGRVCSP